MKKKIRKNTQLTFINPKGAGRPSKNDKGIRHTPRPIVKRLSSLHLTIKIHRIKADIKNKIVLSLLKKAILHARRKGLRVIHFTLEYDHIHLLIEADNNQTLGKGMQAFGVTLAKGINKIKKLSGEVYKHRYHFRKIYSPKELRNVLNYIFTNGVKHKTAKTVDSPFNSIKAEKRFQLFFKGPLIIDWELKKFLDDGKVFFKALEFS